MRRLRRTLKQIKKYSGMISMAATAGIVITTFILKMKNKNSEIE